jgi:HEAT repeat protein
MSTADRPRRKAFGPLFYTTAAFAAVLLAIRAAASIVVAWDEWSRERQEAQALRELVAATRDGNGEVRANALRSILETTKASRSFLDRPSRVHELLPLFVAGASDPDDEVRVEAARAIGLVINVSAHAEQGDAAPTRHDRKDCFRALRHLLRDPSPFVLDAASVEIEAFAGARGASGFEGKDEVVAELTAVLSDPDRERRRVAAKTLLSIQNGRCSACIDALLSLLADPKPIGDRPEVARILNRYHEEERASKALAGLLGSGDEIVLSEVLATLESLGSGARAAVPAIEPFLDSKDFSLRTAATKAIMRIEGNGDDGRPTLRVIAIAAKVVADPEFPIDWRVTAVEMVLGSNPAALSHAAGVLTMQLASDDPAIRRSALDLLSMLIDQVRPEPPRPASGR